MLQTKNTGQCQLHIIDGGRSYCGVKRKVKSGRQK